MQLLILKCSSSHIKLHGLAPSPLNERFHTPFTCWNISVGKTKCDPFKYNSLLAKTCLHLCRTCLNNAGKWQCSCAIILPRSFFVFSLKSKFFVMEFFLVLGRGLAVLAVNSSVLAATVVRQLTLQM